MKLHNADLDKTIEVPDNADVRVYERNGWAPATESETATEPDEPGPLLPDALVEGNTVPGKRGESEGTLQAGEEIVSAEDDPRSTKRRPKTSD